MEKQEIIFDVPEGKKHSVCYKTKDKEAAIQSVYIMRHSLGTPVPKVVKITIEEV
jgi:hypothetical protein